MTEEWEEYMMPDLEKKDVQDAFDRIKKTRPKNLDDVFHAAHDLAFEKINCLNCGNCCKTTSPIFRDVDVSRIAKKFKMTSGEFENRYLRMDDENDWVLQESPCAFLNEDNSCFIYDVRPQACREYPHTDRKKMYQVLDLTKKNMDVCPAVNVIAKEVVNEFKK